MCMLKLRLVLMLFGLIGLIGLPVVPAIAACSGCCGCNMGCSSRSSCCCPGVGGCKTCAVEDFETFQSSSVATEANSDMTLVRKPMALRR